METTTATLTDYLKGIGLKIKVSRDYNDNAPDIWERSNHYRVTLSREGRKMSFWYYQGYGIKEDPTLEGVVETLSSDRSLAQMSLDEFGGEFGWDKNTHKNHRHLLNLNRRYERVIGDDSLLDEIYERVTA